LISIGICNISKPRDKTQSDKDLITIQRAELYYEPYYRW